MNKRHCAVPYLQTSAVGLAVSLLISCGGGGDSGSTVTESPASVQMSQTATILSVRTEQRANGKVSGFEAQALNYTFAASIDSGPNAGYTLTGRLQLSGEREDDGVTEIEGRLFPDADPSRPTRAELKARFEADRKGLKGAMRADIKVLAEELKLALAYGAVPGADEPSAAQKEALATFKAKFGERMTQYRAALSALIAQYRGAKRDANASRHDDDDDDMAARGFEVRGTIDANAVVSLTVKLGDKGKFLATGTIAADGSASGSLTGAASGDSGTWTAGAEGAELPLPEPLPEPPPAGTYAAGLTKYLSTCATCHSAGTVYTAGGPDLARKGGLLVADLGTLGGRMSGITLTPQEILDLQAFLAAVQ